MTRRRTTQSLFFLAAVISAGTAITTVPASAGDEMTKPSSRMEMILEKLTPDNQSFAKGNSQSVDTLRDITRWRHATQCTDQQ